MFKGFSKETLRFLTDLSRNNDRAWFSARKAVYEREVAEPMKAFVAHAAQALNASRIPIQGDAKRSIFRIYRDVRFSPDKTPYKTHAAAYLSYDGARATPGGLYIHIEPGSSCLSIAFYKMPRPMLRRWRIEISSRPKRFLKIVHGLREHRLHILLPHETEETLSRMPRGFEAHATGDIAPYLRLTSFLIHKDLTNDDVCKPRLVDQAVTLAKNAKPLLEFGWSLE